MTETDTSQMTEQRDTGPLYVYGIVTVQKPTCHPSFSVWRNGAWRPSCMVASPLS